MKPSMKTVTCAFACLTTSAATVAAQPTTTDPETTDDAPPSPTTSEPTPLEAQDQPPVTIITPPPTVIETRDEDAYTDRRRLGIAFTIGGGVSGFTADTLRGTTSDGGNWVARAAVGLFAPLALELSYIGSVQSIDALGLDDSALLVGNGGQAALRLNLPGSFSVIPFVFGGVAWRHYSLVNTDANTSDISDTDNVYEFPVGAGVSATAAGVLVDLRGEFAYVTDGDMVPNLQEGDDAAMHRWGINLSVGVAL